MKFLVLLVQAGAVCLSLVVLLGFAGWVHPVFDTLSLVRLPVAVICLLVLVFPMRARLRLLLGAAVLLGAGTTVPLLYGAQDSADLRVYSKNMWFGNRQLDPLADDIRASGANVVTLQEVSNRNRALLVALQDTYPYQHLCRFSGWSGNAVLSRTPIENSACSDRRAVAAAQVQSGQGPVWVASVHLRWPYPYGNAASARAGADLLSGLEGPVVMAGDFNIFPWAQSVRSLQDAAGLTVARPLRPTFDLRGVPLLLDHVHAPGGGQARYRPLLGSDHLGVLADVSLAR